MKKCDFYTVELDFENRTIGLKLQHGYEDELCYYHKIVTEDGKKNWWGATEKNTGMRLLARKTKKECEAAMHSDAFLRKMDKFIKNNTETYRLRCEAYKNALEDAEHKYTMI